MESIPESVQDAFEEFLARRESGENVDVAAFVARHAALGPDLASAIEAFIALESLDLRGSGTDDVPDRVGPYRVVREIGRGGMGLVLEAVEEPLGRRVALKVLPAEMLASQSARARFRREAELAARLDHAGIATIFGAGVEAARPWIAMRFVEGRTLASLIAEAQAAHANCVSIPGSAAREPEVAVALCLARVAHALHAAHQHGVVHRDVKPSNIIVSSDGTPVLLDFGLALPEESDGNSLTRTGETAGTPAYIAPEQLSGERSRPDAQRDVYSLGVTLYECLALRRPFTGPTPVALYRAIAMGSTTDVRVLNRRVSRDLAVIVATAMERDRARRYATAAAMARDLEACAAGRPIAARPVPLAGKVLRWARREPRQAVLVGLLLVATLALASFGGTWWASRDEVHAAETAARELERDQELWAGYDKLHDDSKLADIHFQKSLELDPRSLEARAGRAFASVWRGDKSVALAFLAGAPDTPGFEALRSLCRGEPVTQDAESSLLSKATTTDLFLIGTCLSQQANVGPESQRKRDHGRALAMFREALVRAPYARPFLHASCAIAAAEARDEQVARSTVAALIALWPDAPRPVFSAGTALYRFDPKAAIPILERATRLLPTDPAPPQVLGNAYQKLGDPASAELWLWRALERKQLAEIYNSLAIAFFSRKCFDEGIHTLKQGLAIDPHHESSLMNLGQVFYTTKQYDLAQPCFERALERDPGLVHAYQMLGWTLGKLGKPALARLHFEHAFEIGTLPSGDWAELTRLNLELRDFGCAQVALDMARELAPGAPELIELQKEIDAAR